MTLLSTLIPLPSDDVISILDEDGNQLIENARPISVSVNRDSKKFIHPLETNAVRADHKIITPVEITMRVILEAENYEDTYQEIGSLFRDSTEVLIQTKADTFDRMILERMPHTEDPSLFDAISMDLRFGETLIGNTVILEVDDSFTTTNRGQLQPSEASPDQTNQGSLLYNAFF